MSSHAPDAPAAHGPTLPLALGALTAFGPLSIDMYLPALPTIQRQLGTTPALVQLTLAAFFVGMGLGQLAYGPVADRFGRKPPLYAGLALYVVASLGCAVAPDVRALIALRFVQALGGAAGAVIPRAVVRDLYRGAEAARLLSLLMLVMGAAPILAPLLGGWLLGAVGWRAIFVVLAGFGVACGIFTAVVLPETGSPRALGGVGALARQFGGVLTDRQFVIFAAAGGFAYAGMFAYIAGSPFVFINLHQLTPGSYGALFATNAFGLIAASQLNRRLLARARPATVLVAATGAMGVLGVVLAAVAWSGLTSFVALALPLFAFVACVGFVSPNVTALAMEEQGARAGVASAVLGALQFAVAAGAAALVGVLNDGTARPMSTVMAVCAASTVLLSRWARAGS